MADLQQKNNNILTMLKIIILICLFSFSLFLSCPSNCLFCSSETTCELCSPKFILSATGSCLPQSVPNCKVQFNSIACAICLPTFQPINGQCIKDYSGCILRDINGDCQYCAFGTVLSYKICKGVLNCQNSVSETQCRKCQLGYSLSRGICVQTRAECASKLPNGVCSACSSQFILNGFTCIGPNKLPSSCALFNSTTEKCSVCQVGFELYRGSCERKDFISFLKFMYTTTGQSNSLAMPQDYLDAPSSGVTKSQAISQDYVDMEIRVKMSSGNNDKQFCWQRSINGLCQICFQGYKLQSGNCIKNTPVCIKFDESNRWCLQCRPELALSKGICTDKNCGVSVLGKCVTCFNSFKVNDEGLCVIDDCVTMQAGECVKCSDGYIITASKFCEKTVESNSLSNIPGCDLVNNGVCLRCKQNFFPNDKGGCKRVIIGCLQYDSKELNCLNCISIYTKTANGGCLYIQNPPTSEQNSNKSQSNQTQNQVQTSSPIVSQNQSKPAPPLLDPNCLIRNNGSCAICRPRYILNLKTLNCDSIAQQCLTFNSSNGDCLSCSAGYNLFGRWCLPPFAQVDQNCISYNINNYCLNCKSQFYKSKGKCFPVNTICKTVSIQGGDCLSCYTGYFLDAGDCVQLTKQPSCSQYDFQMNCVRCFQRYYLQGGLCLLISPLCNNFNVSSGVCSDCVEGYGISSKSNVCELVKTAPTNCQKADQVGNCLNCNDRFYLRNSDCLAVPTLCAKYEQVGGKCLECANNLTLLQDNNCLRTNLLTGCQGANIDGSCSACIPQYVLNGNGGCMYRDPFCLNYQSGECLKCNDAYYLSSGKCIKKVKKNKDPNCLINDLYNFCMTCSSGFYISAGNCQLADQLCATFDPSNGNCLSCYDGYRLNLGRCYLNNSILNCKMFNGNICSVCQDNYYVGKDGSCIHS